MRAVFPRSDYYGDSAPRPRRHRTCRLAELRGLGARIEVPMFEEETRGAVGERLYPWQHGPRAESGHGGGMPKMGIPSHAEIATERWLHARANARGFAPYRGLQHRLQPRITSHRFTLAPSVARLGAALLHGQFRPLGCCRPPIQSSATFAVPFCTRPDPGEDDAFSFGHRFLLRLMAHVFL
jgi:hypothetical protein